MKQSRELQVKISELTQQLNEFNTVTEPTSDQIAEAEARQKELPDLERRYRLAIAHEDRQEQATEKTTEPERREWDALLARARLGAFVDAAVKGSTVTGAEAEVRQELGLAADQLPLDLLAPPQLERRADTATPIPTTQQQNQQTIAGRVFASTVANQMLGVEFPTVAAGTPVYPILATAPTPGMKADDTAVESTAGSFTTASVEPERITGRVSFRGKDTVRFIGLEQALRQDIQLALANSLDLQLIKGDGVSPNLDGLMNGLTDSNTSTALATFASVAGDVGDLLDGLYARDMSGIRLVSHPGLMSYFNKTFRSNESESTIRNWVQDNTGGFMTSANMDAVSATKIKALAYLSQSGQQVAVSPVWRGVSVTRDATTDVAKDWVHITLAAYVGFAVLRDSAYKQLSFKVA